MSGLPPRGVYLSPDADAKLAAKSPHMQIPPRGVYVSQEQDAALAAKSVAFQFSSDKVTSLMQEGEKREVLPKALDWRAPNLVRADGSIDNTNKILSVGDQGPCGSCYMFGVVYQLAAYIAIHSNRAAQRINVYPFLSQCACAFADTCAVPNNKDFTLSGACGRCGGGAPNTIASKIADAIDVIQSRGEDAYVKHYDSGFNSEFTYPFSSLYTRKVFEQGVDACVRTQKESQQVCRTQESLSKTKQTVFQLKQDYPLFISDQHPSFNSALDQKIPASTQCAVIRLNFTSCLREKEAVMMYLLNKYGPLTAHVQMGGLFAGGSPFNVWPYVYTGPVPSSSQPVDVDHLVLLIGYTRIQTQVAKKGLLFDVPSEFKDVWILQNSWGTNFGNNGIFYLPRGAGGDSGWTQKDWQQWPHGPLNFLSSTLSVSVFYSAPKIYNDCKVLYPNSYFSFKRGQTSAECTECEHDSLDLSTKCTTCKDPRLTPDSSCVMCAGDKGLDPSTECLNCFPFLKKVGGKCDTCIDELTSTRGGQCNECKVWGKDPNASPPCSACKKGHVSNGGDGGECYACAPGWLGGYSESKMCTPGCPTPGLDPSGDAPCSQCHENWGPPKECTGCVGGYDPASYPPCSVCKANYDEGCQKCQTQWDPAADCQKCLPGYDPASNCTACVDGSPPPCKHLFQCDRDGKQLEQDQPQQARGWCTQEEGCCKTLAGAYGNADTWQSVYCSKFCENFNCPASCMESCTTSGVPSPAPYIRGYSLGAIPEETMVAEYIKANPTYVIPDPTQKLKLNASSLTEDRVVLKAIHDTPAWTGDPNTVDYVRIGKVTKEVVNQSDCGACAIFAATSALESWIAIDQGVDAVTLCIEPFIEADRSIPHDTCVGQAVITAMNNLVKHCATGNWLRPLNPSPGKDNTEDSWMWKTYFLNKWEVKQQCTKMVEDDLTASCTSLIPNRFTSATTCPNRDIPGWNYIQFNPTHVKVQSVDSLKSIFCSMFKSYGAEYDRREAIYEHALRQYGPFPVTLRFWPNPDPKYNGCIEKVSGYMLEDEYSWLDPVPYMRDSYSNPHGLHAVMLVGYSAFPDGRKYWVIKNSWGERWGCKGYAKIPRGRETWTLPYDWNEWSDPQYGPFDITRMDPMFYAK